ncbi:MAG: hypothetical protein J5723_08875, partial [Ruminococcus sp.]|nr:hypothetical protein [Ruminococcus sp.]
MKKLFLTVAIVLMTTVAFADDAEAKKLLDAYKMVEVEAENYTFAVGVTEVTQQLYEAVFEENIFKFKFKLLPAESMS